MRQPSWSKALLGALVAATALAAAALAAPLTTSSDLDGILTPWANSTARQLARRDAKPFTIRLMPLGASITQGIGSSKGYGYRKPLRDQLRSVGWDVNMVGSKRDGEMVDQDNEGHPSWIISDIVNIIPRILWMQPNVVTINLGTNDCTGSVDIDNAKNRFADVIDQLLDGIPGVTILASTILENASEAATKNVAIVNPGYRDVVAQRAAAGKRIVLAEMTNGYITKDMLVDGTHPTDDGFLRMAAVWWDAFQKAEAAGFLQSPNPRAMDDKQEAVTNCEAGKTRGPVDTQPSTGDDDGLYSHSEKPMAKLLDVDGVDLASGAFFAELVSSDKGRRQALDDLVFVDGSGSFSLWVNEGEGKFGDKQSFDPALPCAAAAVAFGDLNNDGLDDVFCISDNGALAASINQGGNPPTFKSVGEVHASPGAYPPAQVRVADIDGDGRADYCVIESNGDIRCWRNGGTGETPAYWQKFGTAEEDGTVVFKGIEGNGNEGVILADLNGDFRDDWLWVGESGEVWTYTNNRGGTGKGFVPNFRSTGQTHPALNSTMTRSQVKFARIYGTGLRDYVYLSKGSVNAKQNTGSGGRYLKGDGVFYCDMRGRGRDDYVWISPDGKGHLFGNTGALPAWDDLGEIFDIKRERRLLRLADWDGDGKCDILAVRESDGAIEMWHNEYDDAAKTFNFAPPADNVVSGGASCAQAAGGVGQFDQGVRVADIDGDGRADYLCMEPNGRTTGWLNPGPGADNMQDVGQVKLSPDLDRANFRFADLTGDNLADLVWLDKYTGDARVWINRGKKEASGSSFTWEDKGIMYPGEDRGANIQLPKLDGLRRADFHYVDPYENTARTWFNECEGKAIGDDDSSLLPLPAYPG